MSQLSDFEVVTKPPPHNKATWVRIVAKIRHNPTGEVRDYPTEGIWDGDDDQTTRYIWEDGNFSCDCNRSLFFYSHAEDMEADCGDDLFSVNLVNPRTGEVFYREFEDAPTTP